jgi:uncharacterized membrane protein
LKASLTTLATLVLFAGSVGTFSCTSGDSERASRDAPTSDTDHKASVDQPAGDSNADTQVRELKIVRGGYTFGHEVRSLRPCGEQEALWVVDRSGLLEPLHGELAPGTTPYAEIFVVAAGHIGPAPQDGFGADYAGMLTVEEVIYAAFEGFGCDFDWGRFSYRAQGNEPFWMVEVGATGMRMTRPGEPDLEWADVDEQRRDGTVVFQAAGADHVPAVVLTIEAGASRDTMSGAYYGLSARFLLGDRSLRGHALRGTQRSK